MNDWIIVTLNEAIERLDGKPRQAVRAISALLGNGRRFTLRQGGTTVTANIEDILVSPNAISVKHRDFTIDLDHRLRLCEDGPRHFGIDAEMLLHQEAIFFASGVEGFFGSIVRERQPESLTASQTITHAINELAPAERIDVLRNGHFYSTVDISRLKVDDECFEVEGLCLVPLKSIHSINTNDQLTIALDKHTSLSFVAAKTDDEA